MSKRNRSVNNWDDDLLQSPTTTSPCKRKTQEDMVSISAIRRCVQEAVNEMEERKLKDDIVTMSAIRRCVKEAVGEMEERNRKHITRLFDEIRSLRKDLTSLESPVKTSTIVQELIVQTSLIPKEPFDTLEDFMYFDMQLKDNEQLFHQFKTELKNYVPVQGAAFVRYSWKKLMTDPLAEKFSWRGTDIKKCARNLTTALAIRTVFVYDLNGREEDFKVQSKSFFQFAKNRQKRKSEKLAFEYTGLLDYK